MDVKFYFIENMNDNKYYKRQYLYRNCNFIYLEIFICANGLCIDNLSIDHSSYRENAWFSASIIQECVERMSKNM